MADALSRVPVAALGESTDAVRLTSDHTGAPGGTTRRCPPSAGTTPQTVNNTLFRTIRLALVWAVTVGLLAADINFTTLPLWGAVLAFVVVLGLIILASFGVLTEATSLAKRFGEPYGSLILTLSVVIIEVVLIVAVMMGPTPAPQIARDSVFSVMMIILNLVVGLAIIVSTRRHGPQRYRRRGTASYVVLICCFGGVAFLLPRLFVPPGFLPLSAQIPVAIAVGATYGVFLYLQMGPWKPLFTGEVHVVGGEAADGRSASGIRDRARPTGDGGALCPESVAHGVNCDAGGASIHPSATAPAHSQSGAGATPRFDSPLIRATILIALLVAISLLAEQLGALIDFGVVSLRLPPALGGVIIATIVFLPETLTTLRAALTNEMQRVINLCLGAFVSTVGLTIPAVLVVGAVRGVSVDLGLESSDLALFVCTLVLVCVTFTRRQITTAFGWAHLTLFAGFVAALVLA